MARRPWNDRAASLATGLALLWALGGCGAMNKVTFTNLADSWVNVRFFVETSRGSEELSSRERFQIRPGETVRFNVSRGTNPRGESALVHMHVQTVTPSWDPPGREYWMEILTEGAVKVACRGEGEKLDFEWGEGELAHIPKRQRRKRFSYHVAGAPQPEP